MLESKVGKLFVIGYTVLALITYLLAFSCGEGACNVYIILPIMPWAFILAEDMGLSFTWAIYPLLVLLNASVAYVIGAAIEWVYNRYRDHKDKAKLQALNDEHAV
jgi:hypothetical protein